MGTVELKKIEQALEELREFSTADLRENRAILSIIGQAMKQRKGVAARMFTCLAEAGVNIEMISQGASEVNVSCVVPEIDVDTAVRVVHTGVCSFDSNQVDEHTAETLK